MCIRDRPGVARGHRPPADRLDGDSAAPRRGRRPDRAGAQGCLLYTSDAADERSSVDLGGRRIIKKQKQAATVWGMTLGETTQ